MTASFFACKKYISVRKMLMAHCRLFGRHMEKKMMRVARLQTVRLNTPSPRFVLCGASRRNVIARARLTISTSNSARMAADSPVVKQRCPSSAAMVTTSSLSRQQLRAQMLS